MSCLLILRFVTTLLSGWNVTSYDFTAILITYLWRFRRSKKRQRLIRNKIFLPSNDLKWRKIEHQSSLCSKLMRNEHDIKAQRFPFKNPNTSSWSWSKKHTRFMKHVCNFHLQKLIVRDEWERMDGREEEIKNRDDVVRSTNDDFKCPVSDFIIISYTLTHREYSFTTPRYATKAFN